MFTAQQKNLLKTAAGPIPGDHYEGLANPALGAAIATIKAASPWLFHTDATLADRKFVHEPRTRTPFKSAIFKADKMVTDAWAADEAAALTNSIRKAMRIKGLS